MIFEQWQSEFEHLKKPLLGALLIHIFIILLLFILRDEGNVDVLYSVKLIKPQTVSKQDELEIKKEIEKVKQQQKQVLKQKSATQQNKQNLKQSTEKQQKASDQPAREVESDDPLAKFAEPTRHTHKPATRTIAQSSSPGK